MNSSNVDTGLELAENLNKALVQLTGVTREKLLWCTTVLKLSNQEYMQQLYDDVTALIKWRAKLSLSGINTRFKYLPETPYDKEHRHVGTIRLEEYEYVDKSSSFIFKLPEDLNYKIVINQDLLDNILSTERVKSKNYNVDLTKMNTMQLSATNLYKLLETLNFFQDNRIFVNASFDNPELKFKYDFQDLMNTIVEKLAYTMTFTSRKAIFNLAVALCIRHQCLEEVNKSYVQEVMRDVNKDSIQLTEGIKFTLNNTPNEILYEVCLGYLDDSVTKITRRTLLEISSLNSDLDNIKDADTVKELRKSIPTIVSVMRRILNVLMKENLVTRIYSEDLVKFFDSYNGYREDMGKELIGINLKVLNQLRDIHQSINFQSNEKELMHAKVKCQNLLKKGTN